MISKRKTSKMSDTYEFTQNPQIRWWEMSTKPCRTNSRREVDVLDFQDEEIITMRRWWCCKLLLCC